MAPIAEHDRLALAHDVFREILAAPGAAHLFHAVDERRGELAFVEARVAFFGDEFERAREIRVLEHPALLRHLAVRQEQRRRAGIARDDVLAHTEKHEAARILREAFAREPDRRRERTLQRQLAVVLRDPGQRGGLARNAGRERTVDSLVAIDLALGIEELPGIGRRRRGLARVDEHLLAVLSAMQQEECAAADARALRLDHGQGRADGDRRVEGVAAGGQHLEAGFGRKAMRARDRGLAGLVGGDAGGTRQHGRNEQQSAQSDHAGFSAWVSSRYLPSSSSRDSACSGSTNMHSTGQTSMHCGTS